MKLSDILNLIASGITFLLIIFLLIRSWKSGCFNWIEYYISFSMLFANLGINILATIGR